MDAISRIDMLFSRMWHFPLAILCRFSGKSNFFWARVTSFVAGSCILCIPITNIFTIKNYNPIFSLPFIVFFSVPMFFMSIRINRLENSFDFTSELLPEQILEGQFDRVIYGFVAVFCCPQLLFTSTNLSSILWGLAMGLMFACIYWTIDYQPPKKSWVKAGVEKLAKLINRIHFPIPTPTPIPT